MSGEAKLYRNAGYSGLAGILEILESEDDDGSGEEKEFAVPLKQNSPIEFRKQSYLVGIKNGKPYLSFRRKWLIEHVRVIRVYPKTIKFLDEIATEALRRLRG